MIDPSELRRRRRRGRELLTGAPSGDAAPTVFVAGTFNLDLLPPLLAESLERSGVGGRVLSGEFGQLAQTLLAPNSKLYEAAPRQVVIVVAAEDLWAPLIERPAQFTAESQTAFVADRIAELQTWLDAMLERLPTTVCYLVTLGPRFAPGASVLDVDSPQSGWNACLRGWTALAEYATRRERIVLVDADRDLREAGLAAVVDERLWYAARMRLSEPGLADLGDTIARHAAAYAGRVRKVAVVDLDNTLWGGVVGEVGWENVQLGNEGIGLAFLDFQRELLKWHDQGVLLAVCSKNNPDDAWQVFDRHPEMILRREHLAAAVVNWTDKATNLRTLAAELNLSTDGFTFFDDNPAERTWIAQAMPEVQVPELPDDPALRPTFLRRGGFFARLRVTAEDARRTEMYQAERSRTALKAQVASVEDYLRSLEQELVIQPLSTSSVPRIAQLCQRTNQFNFTQRRYSEAELDALRRDSQVAGYVLRLRDRFGDHGVIGFAAVRLDADQAELDSFLLSCRVLGRRVEHAVLSTLRKIAGERGAARFGGRFAPTAKNVPAAEFLASIGAVRDADERFVVDDAVAAKLNTPEIAVRLQVADEETTER